MSSIKLPKDLGEYFFLKEDDRTEDCRRFHLYFPYREGSTSDRLHWEWTVSDTEEAMDSRIVGAKLERARKQFKQHIEQWLDESGKMLVGEDPLPELREQAD